MGCGGGYTQRPLPRISGSWGEKDDWRVMWEKTALASDGVIPVGGGGDRTAWSRGWGRNLHHDGPARTRDSRLDPPLTSCGISRKWPNLSKSQLPDL